jgi:CDP-2,3-bis-(O-geranylgeranyl)-sn-glycerol synthase
LIVEALKFIFPAYCANAIPVITGRGIPIDFNKKFFDGKPIFGKNKTLIGFLTGFFTGTAVGFIESIYFGYNPFIGLILSLGALFGDLMGSFIKRRLGINPGKLLPIIDQIDFVLGAVLFSLLMETLSPNFVLVILIITPPLHLLTNFVAYKVGLKSNPW